MRFTWKSTAPRKPDWQVSSLSQRHEAHLSTVTLCLWGSPPHVFPIILHFPSVLTGTDSVMCCGFLTLFFSLLPCVMSLTRLCSAGMPDPNSRYFWTAWLSPAPPHLPPPACTTSAANPQRHQLQREPCYFLTQACSSSPELPCL